MLYAPFEAKVFIIPPRTAIFIMHCIIGHIGCTLGRPWPLLHPYGLKPLLGQNHNFSIALVLTASDIALRVLNHTHKIHFFCP